MKLYGNGINDDAPAIQEMLDARRAEVILPPPEKCYCIGTTLKIHANQTLKMGEFTLIRLMKDCNCAMIEDDDFYCRKENICVDGGIWDMNSLEQEANPYHFPGKSGKTAFEIMKERGESLSTLKAPSEVYTGMCMRFCRIDNLTVKNVTLRNPVTYGVQIAFVNGYTFSDITFDYKAGSPKKWNMDGIHVEGDCFRGVLRSLKGACHDDLVALTADDGIYGTIKDVEIDGIFAEHCHSAVRILSHGLTVENVSIKNVYGSFYTYCVGITKYHGGEEERGVVKSVSIEKVYASASEGTEDVKGGYYPFIWVQKGVDVCGLNVSDVTRREKTFATPLLKVDEGASVENLCLRDVRQESFIGKKIELLALEGDVTFGANENVVNLVMDEK